MSKQIVFAFSALLIIACSDSKKDAPPGQGAASRQANMPINAEGYVVRTKAMSEKLEVPGTLLPFEETEIRSEISGRVVYLNIREGASVRKGSLLAKLYDGDLQAQLKKLQVQQEISQKTVERYRELLKIQGISQQEYDLAELQVNNLKADIDIIRVDIGRTQIVAPYNGNIGLRNVSVGAYISPTNLIATLRQVSQLKLDFAVPEKYSDNMAVGQQVKFTVEGSNQTFTATVMARETKIEADTRTLRIKGLVKGNNPALIPGAFTKVDLQLGKNEDALVVPTQAVIPQARNKKVIIYKDGVVNFETVTTGIRDSSFVEVTSGLSAGDTIVTTGLLSIRPDSKVKLTKVQ